MEANWFIGLPFAAACLAEQELARLPPGTRAFTPDDLHVTVAFLGAVDERSALRAWGRLETGAALPLSAAIGPRAVFGPPRRPSALGLDLDPGTEEGPLSRFIAQWRNALRAAAGLAPEQRPVRPHVTLGRPPRRTDAHWQHEVAAWIERSPTYAPVRFDRIALYTRADPGSRRRFREVRAFPSSHPDNPCAEHAR